MLLKSLRSGLSIFFLFFSICNADEPRQTIVVTCATGEIGQSVAKHLAETHNLLLLGRNPSKLEQLQKELTLHYPGMYETFPLDFLDSASIHDFLHTLEEKRICIKGLVLITPRPHFSSGLLQAEQEWLTFFQANFTGPLEVLKGVLLRMSSESKIVIIGGTTSVQVIPEYGPACIIRRMWTTHAKALSHELGPKGIHVNVLSPGVVFTNYHKDRITKKAEENQMEFAEQLTKEVGQIPLRRYADVGEVVQVVRFLLSDESNYITGINLVIDGGFTKSYQ